MTLNTKTSIRLLILMQCFVLISESCKSVKTNKTIDKSTTTVNKLNKSNKSVVQLNKEANKLIKKKKYDNALDLLNQAAKIDKNDYFTFLNMTNVYVKKKQFEKAIYASKKILKIKPKYAEVCTFTGMLYEQIGNLSTAKKYYKKSMQIFDNRIKNTVKKDQIVADKFNRAIALMLLGKEKEGKAELEKIKTDYPDDMLVAESIKWKRKDFINKALGGL